MIKPPRPGWYSLAATLGTSLVTAILMLFLTLHFVQQSERKWCDLITMLDDAYHQTPPTTETGKNVARQMSGLRQSLHCPKEK